MKKKIFFQIKLDIKNKNFLLEIKFNYHKIGYGVSLLIKFRLFVS